MASRSPVVWHKSLRRLPLFNFSSVLDRVRLKETPKKVYKIFLEGFVHDLYTAFIDVLNICLNFCPDCGSPVVGQKKSYTGSMATYVLHCHNGCTVRWNSQPKVDREPLGNILIAAAILFTGLTFKRMSDWAAALKLKFISQTSIQKSILWPVVGEAWREQKRAIREMKARRGAIMLGGDVRCDSPGHNALYGTYTLMDIRPNAPNIIVSMELLHSSEVKNSHHLEPEGLRRCLQDVIAKKVKIGTLATDQHLIVGKMMREDFPKIDHQLDAWHCSKNLTKKLTAKAKTKGCEALMQWIRAISNHLWYSASTCKKKTLSYSSK
ncbi:hypothetical protein CAPTEDRAFT_113107 [Capitella teleta]|uniref:Uncharacterized protein n=1 Tax=Capitella teleta TaxID=283909 RepID=R7T408_CAPTE|nr:hypothetical protein CAPTEDRAFT_113107 [Capitella teleta]|eukprot:ELT87456.1 hypothetical protein CAPTEDRAFT_113107 [Capitella teleta]